MTKDKGGHFMPIKIQKLTLWFYIFFFSSLYSLSKLRSYANQGMTALIVELLIIFFFMAIGIYFLIKRKKAIEQIRDKTNYQSLYKHEWTTAAIVCVCSVIDSFFLTKIAYFAYLIAVFYHLYWFLKHYTMNSKKDV